MDDRWPGSPPTPPEQPAGDWGAPADDPPPGPPLYLPPPSPMAPPPAEPADGPVAEPGWAWRTSRPAPPAAPAPSHPPYHDQRYDDQPAFHDQRYDDQPAFQGPQYADPWYDSPAYDAAAGGPGRRWEPTPARPAMAARATRSTKEPRRKSPTEPVDEPVDEPPHATRPGLVGTLLWTLGAFVVPLLLYLGWTATLDTTPRPGCVDVAGGPCPGARAQAVTNLLNVLPALVVALGAALLLALGIRYIAVTWRSYKVAFAASVIGAGVTTLLVGALN